MLIMRINEGWHFCYLSTFGNVLHFLPPVRLLFRHFTDLTAADDLR